MSDFELRSCSLFRGLDDEDLSRLTAALEARRCAPGAQLFAEGAPGEGLWIVVAGRLRLTSRRRGECGSIGAGATLGAASLVAPGPRELSAIAESECQLGWLSAARFKTLVDDAPRLAYRVLEAIARELACNSRAALDAMPEAEGASLFAS